MGINKRRPNPSVSSAQRAESTQGEEKKKIQFIEKHISKIKMLQLFFLKNEGPGLNFTEKESCTYLLALIQDFL